MNDTKMKEILTAMQGITYLEWKKLQHAIDVCFNTDTGAAANKIQLADAERIVENYQCLYGK